MGFVKGYVRNQYRPEGSIVQGYADEEVVQFYTNYMDDVADIGLPQPRHQGRLDKVGTIGRKDVTPTNDDFEQADFTVLQNMTYKVIRISPTNVDADVIHLGYRPRYVLQYQGYDITGYTFYTKQQDDKSTMQNSGLTLIVTTTDSSKMTIEAT
ncbi:ulp1 protease family, C-terminal catalytic domain-containing protein, partial [Tanacetum coccineum]